MCVRTCVHTQVSVYECLRMCAHVSVCVCVNVHMCAVYESVCRYVCVHACVHVCECVCAPLVWPVQGGKRLGETSWLNFSYVSNARRCPGWLFLAYVFVCRVCSEGGLWCPSCQ